MVKEINMDNVITRTELIFFIAFFVIYFLSWVFVRILCDYKYLVCNGNCKRCRNWRCKQHAFRPVVKKDSYACDIYCCRACGNQVDWRVDTYCHSCGHKVDWSMISAPVMDEFWENAKR